MGIFNWNKQPKATVNILIIKTKIKIIVALPLETLQNQAK